MWNYYNTQGVYEIVDKHIEKYKGEQDNGEKSEESNENWFSEMEEAEKRKEHEEWLESLEKGANYDG